MADARAHDLPLVGGGEHDWTRIFTSLGLLTYDTTVANFVRFIGWLGLISTMLFVTYQWNQYRGQRDRDNTQSEHGKQAHIQKRRL
jgi:hypothetical protein